MIITFYSFKGGVGRSMAMVNVGEILAEAGYRVLLCDWDLEAPGLERYLVASTSEVSEFESRMGLMDLLAEYKGVLASPYDLEECHENAIPPDHRAVGRLLLRRPSSYAFPVSLRRDRPGSLALLTAGARGGPDLKKYAEAVRTFDWQEFYEKWAGASYLDFFRSDVSRERNTIRPSADEGWPADVVLVDSRTGVTEHGGVCTHHLADVVVLLSAANDQNVDGTLWMAKALANPELVQSRGGRALGILPVAARIEQTAEKTLLTTFRNRFKELFARYVPSGLGIAEVVLDAVEVPYMPFYSFNERVAAREPADERERRLFEAYANIAGAIVRYGVEQGFLEEPVEPVGVLDVSRALQSKRFEPPSGTFVVAWAPQDADFGDRVLEGLTRIGVRASAPLANLERSGVQAARAAWDGSNGCIIVVGDGAGSGLWLSAELAAALKRQALRPGYTIVGVLRQGRPTKDLSHLLARSRVVEVPEQLRFDVFPGVATAFASRAALVPEDPSTCPYVGPTPFAEEQARFFFGRDRHLWDLAEQIDASILSGKRCVIIDGPSGCGKTSLINAGIVPSIRRGLFSSSVSRWKVASCRPGPNAVVSMASAIARLADHAATNPSTGAGPIDNQAGWLGDAIRAVTPPDGGVVLILDQLEELFSADGADDTVRDLDRWLAEALADLSLPILVLTVIRSEAAGELPRLSNVMQLASRLSLDPMTRQELFEATTAPAALAGLEWESGLVDRLIADFDRGGYGLSLLSIMLAELWKQRVGKLLTNSAYQSLAGFTGLVVRHAQAKIETEQFGEDRVRNLLLRLVSGTGSRRVITISEAIEAAGGDDIAEHIVAVLAEPPQLITVGRAATVQLSNDSLIRDWGLLRAWIELARDDLNRRDQLEAASAAWNAADRPLGGLPDGKQLAYFREVKHASETAREFLEAAVDAQERRALELRRRRWARTALLALIVIAGGFGTYQWGFRRPRSRQVAVEALTQSDPVRALVLAKYAGELADTDEARTALRKALAERHVTAVLPHGSPVLQAEFSADASLCVTAGGDSAWVWDVATGSKIRELKHESIVGARFDAGGRRVATAGFDSTVRMWEVGSGRLRTLQGHEGPVIGVRFDASGGRVITAGVDGTGRVWDADTGEQLLLLKAHRSAVNVATFSPDGHLILTAGDDGAVNVWDSERGVLRASLLKDAAPLVTGTFSEDGTRVIVGSRDGTAYLWDFNPSRSQATSMANVTGGSFMPETLHHYAPLVGVFFARDRRVVTATEDGNVALWSSSPASEPPVIFRPPSDGQSMVRTVDFARSRSIVVAGDDGIVWLVDTLTSQQSALKGHVGAVRTAVFSHDGRLILTGGDDNTARIWTADAPEVSPSSTLQELLALAQASLPVTLTAQERRGLSDR